MKNIVVGPQGFTITVEGLEYSFFKGTNTTYHHLDLIKKGVVFHSINLDRQRLKYDFTSKDGIKFYDVVNK